VVKNGQEIYTEWLDPHSGTTFATNLTLNAGETVDFAVGRGADGVQYATGLKIQTTLSLVSTYDVSRDFSRASNPNGPWSYGYKPALNGSFTPLVYNATGTDAEGVLLEFWFDEYGPPAVYHNPSSETAHTETGDQGIFPPGSVWFSAGTEEDPGKDYGVIRFTVPFGGGGTYSLKTMVESYLMGPISGDTDFHVVKNGTELFGQSINANAGATYETTLSLSPGDVIDFAVGRGADNQLYASALKIQARLDRR